MTPDRRFSGVTEPHDWGAGPVQWGLPAEPLLDTVCIALAGLAWWVSVTWAALWLHALGWWAQGPLWLHETLRHSAGSLLRAEACTDAFFWLNTLVAMATGAFLWDRLNRHRLARTWVLRRATLKGRGHGPNDADSTADLPWSWWSLDPSGQASQVRQGEVFVRLDLGPWLLLQARPAADRRADWMLVRPERLGPQGAAGSSLRAALNWP